MRLTLICAIATLAIALPHADQVNFNGLKNGQWQESGATFQRQNNVIYEVVEHPNFAAHQLRVQTADPKLCDSTVKQISGYLDIDDNKHLFFWFFESRRNPQTDPLTLWLNGGPGCSSSTGLLFELGPCSITNEGRNTTRNPHSWTEVSSVIFLDQPVNVGYSYADNGKTVNTSPVAAIDVHAFLSLFLMRFPQYSDLAFHLAAESYGGIYAPNIASVILRKNKELSLAPMPKIKPIKLTSVILANGETNTLIQMPSLVDILCDGPFPVLNSSSPDCANLRVKASNCASYIQTCRKYKSRFTCVPAALYCNSLYGPIKQSGLNPYDARIPCDEEKNGPLCYGQMKWIDTWMNDPLNKVALGVNTARQFQSCNMDVNKDFALQADSMADASLLLPEIINDGIRLLVYAGNADLMCNYIGNERWMQAMEGHVFYEEFRNASHKPWVTLESGKQAGEVRKAGPRAGNVTFVNVWDAGHMVPYNQPVAALDLFSRWITNKDLS